jgi:hypothetical protein
VVGFVVVLGTVVVDWFPEVGTTVVRLKIVGVSVVGAAVDEVLLFELVGADVAGAIVVVVFGAEVGGVLVVAVKFPLVGAEVVPLLCTHNVENETVAVVLVEPPAGNNLIHRTTFCSGTTKLRLNGVLDGP